MTDATYKPNDDNANIEEMKRYMFELAFRRVGSGYGGAIDLVGPQAASAYADLVQAQIALKKKSPDHIV